MIFDWQLHGIPCKIEVLHFRKTKNDFEIKFNVVDRHGRVADWLARHMSEDDIGMIDREIIKRSEL